MEGKDKNIMEKYFIGIAFVTYKHQKGIKQYITCKISYSIFIIIFHIKDKENILKKYKKLSFVDRIFDSKAQ